MHTSDIDPLETQEWLDALDSVLRHAGKDRATYLLQSLNDHATETGTSLPSAVTTPFYNTIAPENEKRIPGDMEMDRRIRSLVRWNAMAMVTRANNRSHGLGGHISSFSSSATLYDVGFNYFFKGPEGDHKGDLIYFQGHISPGIYARSFLEGRFSKEQLDLFRHDVDNDGQSLTSYPHPWIMPDYWQFPTVSMGLGPIQAIYQAHVMKYLHNREMVDNSNRRVWAFLGDGECDEPETLGAIALAGRERLDKLIFVINCNLQRLDGLVRGNGKIIQELEGVFRGAGWNVIKVVWGRHWDPLLEKDKTGLLKKRMDEVCDGDLQNYVKNGGAYTREHFFGKYPELLELVKDLSDEDIMYLNRGGHDPSKVYAAYAQAVAHTGQPTVILAHTVKGYGTGLAGEANNTTHSLKSLDEEELIKFRDRFHVPISDEEAKQATYYRPEPDSPEIQYMVKRRKDLGGFLPQRYHDVEPLDVPDLSAFKAQLKGTGEREISTTMAYTRILSTLVKDKKIGQRIVPIIPDEARTFGMEGMFRQIGIYSSRGQLYTPYDADQIMSYTESEKGQIMEEGITESGATAAWIAQATAYSTHGVTMVPFYAFYSMFGFQRTMDLLWAAGDQRARGFLMGGTAGRTTLKGEGLQHMDGHSHVMANMIPNCISYDPTYSYELAVIIQHGLKHMFVDRANVFYYITMMNENYAQPDMPEGVEEGIIKGMYLLQEGKAKAKLKVQLMGSGTILREAIAAAQLLKDDWAVEADIWSVTSANELRRNGQHCTRYNRMHPTEKPLVPYITEQLQNRQGPVVAVSDYIMLFNDQLREYIPHRFTALGTDGFGRSDARGKLRHFFEVNKYFITIAALKSLADEGLIKAEQVAKAIKQYNIDPDKADPATH